MIRSFGIPSTTTVFKVMTCPFSYSASVTVLRCKLSDVVRKLSAGARNVEARAKRALNFLVQKKERFDLSELSSLSDIPKISPVSQITRA